VGCQDCVRPPLPLQVSLSFPKPLISPITSPSRVVWRLSNPHLLTGPHSITPITRLITVCELRYSLGVIGSVRRVTGGVRVGFGGLDKRFTAAIKDLTGVIGNFGK
jgi:hypothetical protein